MSIILLILICWVINMPKRRIKHETIPKPGEHHLRVDEFELYEVLSDEERNSIFH